MAKKPIESGTSVGKRKVLTNHTYLTGSNKLQTVDKCPVDISPLTVK